MLHTGRYCKSTKNEYDVDHVINDVNERIENVIKCADFGEGSSVSQDIYKQSVIKAAITQLLEMI